MQRGIRFAVAPRSAPAACIVTPRHLRNDFAACPAIRLNKVLIFGWCQKNLATRCAGQHPEDDFCQFDERPFSCKVPDEYIITVARVMKAANWHTYQVLTKRADRLQDLLKDKLSFAAEQPAHLVGRECGES